MLRVLIASLATLLLAGCFYHSDIDLAPLADRIAAPVIAPGDYCEATASSPPYVVKSAEDCQRISWDQATRTYLMEDDKEGEGPIRVAPVSLGGDLYLLQGEGTLEDAAGKHQLTLVVAKGSALFLLPTLERDRLVSLAAKHPGVTLAVDEDGDPVIREGDAGAIRSFLGQAAREALRGANLEDDEELSIAIRDRAGAPDHEANGMQTMNIIELVTTIFALQGEE